MPHFLDTIQNFVLSTLDDRNDSELVRKITLMYGLSSVGICTLVLLGTLALFQGAFFLGTLDFLAAAVLIGILYTIRYKGCYTSCLYTGVVVMYCLFLYLFFTGGVKGTAFMWVYTFPLFSLFLLGERHGLIATLLLFIPCSLFIIFDIVSDSIHLYTMDFAFRFIPSFLAVFLFSYIYEKSRETTQRKLETVLKRQDEIIKERTAQLTAAADRSQRLFDLASDAFFVHDFHTGKFTDTNKQAYENLGYTRDEILTLSVTDIDVDYSLEEAAALWETIEKGKTVLIEGKHQRKDGSTFPVEVNIGVFQEKDPTLLLAIARDISQRKQDDEKLRESEENYRLLFESGNDGICVYQSLPAGMPGKFIKINHKTCEMLGYTKEELLQLSPIDTVAPERLNEIPSIIEAQQKAGGHSLFETTLIRKDNNRIEVEISDHSFEVKGHPYTLSIVRDITERKQAEKALQKTHDELEIKVEERTRDLRETHNQLLHAEKLSAIGRLSACIAHEFNNPLHGVMNVISGIKKYQDISEDYLELTDIALNECNRMKLLIRELQQFNRPSSGKNELFDIHKALDTILLFHTKNFENRKIEITKGYDLSIPEILAVQDQIKQVFINLFNNAADSMPDEGGKIIISTSSRDDMIYIHIQDTGTGITPKDQEKIFEPFFTTKLAVKGTGLGLPVSYGIIKSHGGDITVTSEPGKGSTFIISLPIDTRPYNEKKNSGS